MNCSFLVREREIQYNLFIKKKKRKENPLSEREALNEINEFLIICHLSTMHEVKLYMLDRVCTSHGGFLIKLFHSILLTKNSITLYR